VHGEPGVYCRTRFGDKPTGERRGVGFTESDAQI
jgi:hypothetical protein